MQVMLHMLSCFSFYFFSPSLFFEVLQMYASLFLLSLHSFFCWRHRGIIWRWSHSGCAVAHPLHNYLSEIFSSFALSIWIPNKGFIFAMDLFLFYPFVTKLTNSEDLNVIFNQSKVCIGVICIMASIQENMDNQHWNFFIRLQRWRLCIPNCCLSVLILVISPWTCV